tara:strand:+ start:119 stop:994 length:876 start_codon:yes stop_codon:yes gene_type:complete
MMMRYFIFSLFLFFCLSCSYENEDDGITQIQFGSEFSLDIITWNLENFPKHPDTIDYVAELINACNDIDIIALQEISSTTQFNVLLNLLGPPWIGYQSESLAYLINTNNIMIHESPYSILEDYEYYFAYRAPYVLHIGFNNHDYILIDVHFKCCGDGIIQNSDSDEEQRRLIANNYLKNYIDSHFNSQSVITLGDFNDELIDEDQNNVFLDFLNDPNYEFSDFDIANGSTENWSYPGWPSHLDHILVYNQYLGSGSNTQTLKLDNYLIGGWNKYNNYISDHRPVGINISFD